MVKLGFMKFILQMTRRAQIRFAVGIFSALTVFLMTPVIAFAYIQRSDNPPGTAGFIIPNGQIVGGTEFVIQHTGDPTLTTIQERTDYYKYGSDGIPIYNGNDTLGGIWGFDHVSHNGVPISENNGYKMVGQSTVSQWIAALKGDPSYVQSHLWNTTFKDGAGQTFGVSNVSQIVEQSGASFVPLQAGQNYFDQPVYATDPPRAKLSISGSDTVVQGKPLAFENHALIEAYHSAYHFEFITVTNAAGQDVTSNSFSEQSLQGRAPYNGETLYARNGAPMVEVVGGGATSYPPTFVESIDGRSGRQNVIDTARLKPGRYRITLYVKDWFNRSAQAATTSFTVTKSSTPPPPPPGGGGGGIGSGGGGGKQCPPPTVPPMPSNEVLSYNWSPDGSGGQMLTWTDTNWKLQTRTDGQGCVGFFWADQPITYQHDYPLNLSNFQVTGLFYDPGQPGDVWSPTNPSASQQNGDAYMDGSVAGGNQALPTFGDPTRSPAVYVRVGGGMAFRLQWTGSPHDMPASAQTFFRLTNPDGESNMWNQSFGLLPATVFNQGDVPTWDPTGNGYPPPATEYGFVYATIPKYAVTGTPSSFSQLTKWNLNGNPETAAQLSATVTFTTASGSSVTWINTDLAQSLGYPTWYFLHQIPDATASYAQPQPNWSRTYATQSFPQIGVHGQLIPRDETTGP